MHGYQFFVGLEVEILGQYTSVNKLLLQDIHKVQQILWLTTTDVIHGIGRNRQTILTILALRGALHHTDNTLYDIIHIGKVASTVAIVENLDGFTLQ